MRRFPRPSYANVASTLALVVALSGTAYAATGGSFVLGRSNTASTRTDLTNSGNFAAIGLFPKSGYPPIKTDSTKVNTNLNADMVDGLHASALQRKVTGACSDGTAIASVGAAGTTSCTTTAIIPIDFASSDFLQLSPSELYLSDFCDSDKMIRFENNSATNSATLNWMFSQGGTQSTVNASGNSLPPFGAEDFYYANQRLEGQWIFSSPDYTVTVNLHTYDGGSSCEIRGTAQVVAV